MKNMEFVGSSERSRDSARKQAPAAGEGGHSPSMHLTRFAAAVEPGRISQSRVHVDVPAGAIGRRPPIRSARILVVDDLEPITALARSILEEAGHQVHTAGDGMEALAAVQDGSYDLVLMDVTMPVLDGISATKAIRALDRPVRDVPIAAMSTNMLPEHIRLYKDAGMNGYIRKPLNRDVLLQQLRELLPAASDGEPMSRSGDTMPGFDREAFDAIRDTMSVDRIDAWLRKFLLQLEAAFPRDSNGSDRERLGKEAHGLVSYSALLGFPQLAQLCCDLEAACSDGRELAPSLQRAAMAARNAEDVVRALLR